MQDSFILLHASAEEIILTVSNNTVQITHSTLDDSEVTEFNAKLATLYFSNTSPENIVFKFKNVTGWSDVEFAHSSASLNAYKQELGYLFN